MITFLLKKNFYDLWDNLFKIVLINIGFIISLCFPVFIPALLLQFPLFGLGARFIGLLWCSVYLSVTALLLKDVSDYGSFGLADFFSKLKIIWPAGLVLGFIVFLAYILCTVVIPIYFNMESITGLVLGISIFWTLIMAALALQFFPAVRARLDTKPLSIIKKCFVIFFDNPMFCIFSLIHNLLLTAICVIPLFLLFPGPAVMLLFLDEGLRLRLLKYDWLEANPDADRRQIPWDKLLADEREKTGTRGLRCFVFPWKE